MAATRAANRAHFAGLLVPLAGRTDLVVLPETFTTGFSMEVETTRRAGRRARPRMAAERWRAALDAAVTGSVITAAGGRYYNRLLWAQPDGELRRYDKRHLFRMGREHEHFTAGQAALSVRVARLAASARWCATTCASRSSAAGVRELDYDLLVYVANWPAARATAWRSCCGRAPSRTRPTSLGVNRVGCRRSRAWPMPATAPRSTFWAGRSRSGAQPPAAADRRPRGGALRGFRARFPAHLDADRFTLEP